MNTTRSLAATIMAAPAAAAAQAEEQRKPELVEVADLDGFVKHLTTWHNNRVATLRHMQQIPEGTPMQVGDGPERPLTGDLLEGFKAGIQVALAQLGTLPFAVEFEQPEQPQEPAEGA